MNKKIKVLWTCPNCKADHKWSWPKEDGIPGPILMLCDFCQSHTMCTMSQKTDKQFVATPNEEDAGCL